MEIPKDKSARFILLLSKFQNYHSLTKYLYLSTRKQKHLDKVNKMVREEKNVLDFLDSVDVEYSNRNHFFDWCTLFPGYISAIEGGDNFKAFEIEMKVLHSFYFTYVLKHSEIYLDYQYRAETILIKKPRNE